MLRPIQKLNQRFTVAQLKARSNRIIRRLNNTKIKPAAIKKIQVSMDINSILKRLFSV